MKKEIEISAKTREEAIEKAVIELGAPSASAIMYTVINEGRKGFLGFGAVDCTIKAVYQVPDAPAEDKPRRDRNHDRRDRNDRNDRRDRRDRAPKKEVPAEEAAEEESAPVRPPVENIDPATASESEQIAYRFICKLVENMALEDVAIAMHPGNNDDMVITVDGENAGVLIGHHGDTLDALQYLANLAANRKEEGEKREYDRITVDVESYRAKREDALRILARKKAHQVLKYKKSIMLEPMNPYERRIIHSEIQKMEGVSTNSIGVEN
ncbi:MAG: KH domain-containing protein, partial [Clostridia bacterium]|nr:KH domain-containing protein [Clostridia bacterium]